MACIYLFVKGHKNCHSNAGAAGDRERTDNLPKVRNNFSIFIPLMQLLSLKIMSCCCDPKVPESSKLDE